mgnify:CR=1 FL=1
MGKKEKDHEEEAKALHRRQALFTKMLLAIVVPIIIQNGITNFVSLLDNLMVGRIGTEQMSGVAIVNQLNFCFLICVLFGAVSGAGIFTAQIFWTWRL